MAQVLFRTAYLKNVHKTGELVYTRLFKIFILVLLNNMTTTLIKWLSFYLKGPEAYEKEPTLKGNNGGGGGGVANSFLLQ